MTTRIDLAREQAFRLGALEVRPSTRETLAAGGREVLQPRIMQVLVALARRPGEVVSRDELITRCWEGAVVGDDAINRCIARLRQLGETSRGFDVETIARVGYRLTPASKAPSPHPAPNETVLLAVLPFDNLSSDPEMQFFSDGVSEEILQAATRLEGVQVVGRASSFKLRGERKAAETVRQELRATHALDGAVRRAGDRVRISAHLIDLSTQITLWSGSHERPLTNLFDIQDDIAASVAAALKRTLAPGKSVAIDPIAHDCFLQARQRYRSADIRADDTALALLEEAVARAPDFAAAWAFLARVRDMNAVINGVNAEDVRAKVIETAERALVLDPCCAAAYLALAQANPPSGFFEERERNLLRAFALAPNDADVLFGLAFFLGSVGRTREGTGHLAHLHAVEPMSSNYTSLYAMALYAAGEQQRGFEILAESWRRRPESAGLPAVYAHVAAQAGAWDLVDSVLTPKVVARIHSSANMMSKRLLYVVDLLRNPTPARRAEAVARAEAHLVQTGTARIGELVMLMNVGELDAAYDIIERASFERLRRPTPSLDGFEFGLLEIFGLDRRFHRDPRFVRWCAKLGLIEYWKRTGHWPDCVEEVAPYYDFKAECARATN